MKPEITIKPLLQAGVLAALLLLHGCDIKAAPVGQTIKSENLTDTSNGRQVSQSDAVSVAAVGATLFNEHCAHCHDGSVHKAPKKSVLQKLSTAKLYSTLTEGVMASIVSHLSDRERQTIAEYLGTNQAEPTVWMCEKTQGWFDRNQPPIISGGGMTNLQNTRLIPQEIAGLGVDDIPNLKLQWAFAFPSALKARSQPAIAGGAVFVGSASGAVYALNANSGCAYWVFNAAHEVRTAITVDDWSQENHPTQAAPSPKIYFADFSGTVYAVDAITGVLRWRSTLADQSTPETLGLITGSVVKYKDRLYVPVAGSGIDSFSVCCQFRGSVSALDADTGELIWKQYTIPIKPTEQKKNHKGAPIFGPSGAGVWGTPTIDSKRQRLYIGTGENTSAPAVNGAAVMAMDLADGKIQWVMQASPGEAYNQTCDKQYAEVDENCPEEYKGRTGLDFPGSSPILLSNQQGQEIVIAGQKTGWIFALDPDDNGKVLWRRSISRGDYNKANMFGMAVDGNTLISTVNSVFANPLDGPYLGSEELGLYALDAFSGQWRWSAPVSRDCKQTYCNGYGAALTAIPGAVFAGSQDGYFRAFDTATGELLWEFATAQAFTTVNGSQASGGTIGGSGPVIANGKVFLNSGYSLYPTDIPGNVLLMFSPEK